MNKKADWRKLMEDYRELVELNYDYEARINCLVLVLDLMGQPSAKQVNLSMCCRDDPVQDK
ncbi:MAG: hypothetical protein KC777_21735 [Cyanobacteria bacterium HKST-UBA02]|nr:hypothetical protein [Cyanobacteria bacterium HKST-UBA02]